MIHEEKQKAISQNKLTKERKMFKVATRRELAIMTLEEFPEDLGRIMEILSVPHSIQDKLYASYSTVTMAQIPDYVDEVVYATREAKRA
jgi:hypothetical protein